ncbi:DPBB-1 domain-containing protein [Mycena chlorophos]|uniref:DPBB-1 domain-containing protein n=1 Tax=Mycena chlorophos TaxID=658473 RepID=A0A8H6T8B3_MYCCL|nr:DPBB-1 domain-containing protein [Mycena chlorophos]
MQRLAVLAFVFVFFATIASAIPATNTTREALKRKYTTAHSLGDAYTFDPRDGWLSSNASSNPHNQRRSTPAASANSGLADLFRGLLGLGSPEPAVATWYTGNDLKNPSCWANTPWTPTDKSFVCATTLVGWEARPKCFQFVEMCPRNTPTKCTFARVVDSCAGCKTGQSHIDLTKAAFTQMADLNEGIIDIHYRHATDPDDWFEDLWGPKV